MSLHPVRLPSTQEAPIPRSSLNLATITGHIGISGKLEAWKPRAQRPLSGLEIHILSYANGLTSRPQAQLDILLALGGGMKPHETPAHLDDTMRYPLEKVRTWFGVQGLALWYIFPDDSAYISVSDERDWRIFLNAIKHLGMPFHQGLGPFGGGRIRLLALPPGISPQAFFRDRQRAVSEPPPPAGDPAAVAVIPTITRDNDPNNERAPATAQAITTQGSDACTSEEEPIDEDSNSAQGGEDGFNIGPVDAKTACAILEGTCILFGLTKEQMRQPGFTYTPPGMKRGLRPMQLCAVFWVLSSKADRNIATALLADEMGLGKTAISLAIATVAHELIKMYQNVKQDRSEQGGRHLTGPGDVCPSGVHSPGLQCPCIANGWSSKIVADLSDGPVLVLGPQDILKSWTTEFSKFIHAGQDGMCLINLHDTPPEECQNQGLTILAKVATMHQNKSKKQNGHIEAKEENYNIRLRPEHGQSRFILLVPATSAIQGIQAKFCREKRGVTVTFTIQPSRIIIDEFHRIKGSRTLQWKLVSRCQARAMQPIYLLCLSGTPMTRDPGDLEQIVRFLNHAGEGWSTPLIPPPASSVQKLSELKLQYNKELKKRVDLANSDASLANAGQSEVISALAALLVPFTLRRRNDEQFAGIPTSLRKPIEPMTEEFRTPEEFRNAVDRLFADAKHDINKRLRDRLEEWRKTGKDKGAPKPTMADVIEDATGGRGTGKFRLLRLCATFPALAGLIGDQRFKNWAFNASDFKGVFRQGVPTEAQNSRAWKAWPEICVGSPKLRRLNRLIKTMLLDQEPCLPGEEEKAAIQGQGGYIPPKKMIIFADMPFVAHVVFLWLVGNFPNLHPRIVGAQVTREHRSNALAPFITPQTVEDMRQADKENPDSPRVLVTTLEIGAEGLNLARANYCVVLEPHWSGAIQEQAFARTDRDGQRLTPKPYLLLNGDNNAEMTVRRRQLNRRDLGTGVWEESSAAPLAG